MNVKRLSQKGLQRLFQQTMDIWIIPEINKRKTENQLPKNFELKVAQIIFSLDRGWNKVRLNEEVKAIAICEKADSKKFTFGDLVYEHDVKNVKFIKLTDADPNCAHITLLSFKGKWIISFDFRYNKKRIQKHIEAAKEFYESAKDDLSNNRLRPFFENSFACAELLAKAVLLQLPDKRVVHGKSHDSRIKKFQNWADLGNVEITYSTTLSRLNSLRPSARYLCSTEFKNENPAEVLKILEEMINFAENIIKDA